MLVRASEELHKPDGQRLREYTEANLPTLKQALFNTAPIHQELEIEELTFTLGKLREELGADDSFVRRLFDERSPAELVVESSALANVEERKRLFDGGRDAIKVSIDPMIAAMRDTIDPLRVASGRTTKRMSRRPSPREVRRSPERSSRCAALRCIRTQRERSPVPTQRPPSALGASRSLFFPGVGSPDRYRLREDAN